MAKLDLHEVTNSALGLKPELHDGVLVVHMSGNGDMTAVATLAKYLEDVHQEAGRLAVTEVGFDLRSLYFMNSSCLKAFVTLVDKVARGTAATYVIRFSANPQLHWQKRSLEALKRLAPRVVRVDEVPVS